MKINQSGTFQKPWACPGQQFGLSLTRKKLPVNSNYVKRPDRLRKITVVDDRRILSMMKKTSLTTDQQIKNTLLNAGVDVSRSMRKVCRKKRHAHEPKHTTSSVKHGSYGLGLYCLTMEQAHLSVSIM